MFRLERRRSRDLSQSSPGSQPSRVSFYPGDARPVYSKPPSPGYQVSVRDHWADRLRIPEAFLEVTATASPQPLMPCVLRVPAAAPAGRPPVWPRFTVPSRVHYRRRRSLPRAVRTAVANAFQAPRDSPAARGGQTRRVTLSVRPWAAAVYSLTPLRLSAVRGKHLSSDDDTARVAPFHYPYRNARQDAATSSNLCGFRLESPWPVMIRYAEWSVSDGSLYLLRTSGIIPFWPAAFFGFPPHGLSHLEKLFYLGATRRFVERALIFALSTPRTSRGPKAVCLFFQFWSDVWAGTA